MRSPPPQPRQAFLSVSPEGVMAPPHSALVEDWFGVALPEMKFADYIRPWDAMAADWFAVGLEALADNVLPMALLIDQLPRAMRRNDRRFELSYTPIHSAGGEKLEHLLVLVRDVTDELVRQVPRRRHQELIRLVELATKDPAGTRQFVSEGSDLVRLIVNAAPGPSSIASTQTARHDALLVHTLKGNCALFGLDSLTHLCHDLEGGMREKGGLARPLTPAERQTLATSWDAVTALALELTESLHPTRGNSPDEPVAARFSRFAEKATYLSQSLGKGLVQVHTDAGGVVLDVRVWAPFWATLGHAISNAIDHGIEAPEARRALNKRTSGTLRLTARGEPEGLVIVLADDGAGIDWAGVAARADARGLAHATHAELCEALWADGISTKARLSTTSGRGMGLAALHQATLDLGGRIEVQSAPGAGTTFTFRFPKARLRLASPAA